jgi:hypothetical protein
MTVNEKKLKQLMTENNFIGHLKTKRLNLTDDTKVTVEMVREYKKILYDWKEVKEKIKCAEPNFAIEMYDGYRKYFPTYEVMEEMSKYID